MDDLEDVGNVIAERELEITDGRTVRVLIGQPQPFPDDGGSFYCPYQILGISNKNIRYTENVRYMGGVDSVQALVLTLQAVGAELYTSDEARAGTLTWLGQRNLGFPVVDSLQELVPEDGE